jgi:transcriptional regulator with XRE-family HTH domain
VTLAARVGSALTALRKERERTQSQIAFSVGISQSQVSRIEAGAVEIEVTLLARWAQALDVEPSHVLIRAGVL